MQYESRLERQAADTLQSLSQQDPLDHWLAPHARNHTTIGVKSNPPLPDLNPHPTPRRLTLTPKNGKNALILKKISL